MKGFWSAVIRVSKGLLGSDTAFSEEANTSIKYLEFFFLFWGADWMLNSSFPLLLLLLISFNCTCLKKSKKSCVLMKSNFCAKRQKIRWGQTPMVRWLQSIKMLCITSSPRRHCDGFHLSELQNPTKNVFQTLYLHLENFVLP